MASKIKVDTLETADGTGSIALSNQLSGMTVASLPTTGTLPALSGANLTALTSANLTGALPAISGASLTSLPSGAVLQTVVETGSDTNTETSTSSTMIASTISDITISSVEATSKCIIWIHSGAIHCQSGSYMDIGLYNETASAWVGAENASFMSSSSDINTYTSNTFMWVDASPQTGTNRYRVYFNRRAGSNVVYYHHGGNIALYSNVVMEVKP